MSNAVRSAGTRSRGLPQGLPWRLFGCGKATGLVIAPDHTLPVAFVDKAHRQIIPLVAGEARQ